jgi:hypothetical protein
MSVWMRRAAELGGLAMIGDGVIAALAPRGHVALWLRGPWRTLMRPFDRHPQLTRVAGIGEAVAGILIAREAIRRGDPELA